MLTTLCIEHFAIVKRLELDFTHGMTAFTGETGAGKSIMIDALMLALGGRADASVVRPGEERCDITAGFNFNKDSEPAQWLRDHDITFNDNEIYLRRIIHAEGRSKSYINGQPFPLQKVKELSEKLVHIHGQHEHQTLMHHQTHREQLDQFSNHHLLLNEVTKYYKEHQLIKQQINHIKSQENERDKIQLLQFQIDELTTLNLQEGEITSLDKEHQMLHHAREYLEYSQQVSALLNGDDEHNICSLLNYTLQTINRLPLAQLPIKNAAELLNNALIQCEEALNEIQHFADKIQLDPERLHEVETRMSAIHNIARKYHKDGTQLMDFFKQLQEEIAGFQDAECKLAELEIQLNQIEVKYNAAATKLSQSRTHHAARLEKEITKCIQQLGMPKGWVKIEITPLEKMQPHGLDRIEYKVCTNPGMEPDSLSKITSGGELSRISLAIQMITAQNGATPTLLFDEVDVGIGGATAALVGSMLRELGKRLQVFCVTHQPQVAACAHQHYKVTKQSDAHQTITEISLLNSVQKISEIARMLGGLTITEQTLLHAEELLLQIN